MKDTSQWYKIIERQIEVYKDKFTEKQYKKYKLDLILRISERVDQFSLECGICSEYKSVIARMVGSLNSEKKISSKQEQIYQENIDELIKHLTEFHGLGLGGEYTTILIFMGIVIGAIVGVILFRQKGLYIGPPLGLAIGIVTGNGIDDRAREEGRVI